MKENGIPKKTRFLWQVRISLIGFIPIAVLLFLCSVTLWCLLPAVILAAALSLKAARSSVIIPELPVSDVELFIKSVTKEENA